MALHSSPRKRLTALAGSVALCAASLGGCGGKPKSARSLEISRPDGEATCELIPDYTRPLVVEWPQHRQMQLESVMERGVAIVHYDCKSLALLPNCSVDTQLQKLGGARTYNYMGLTHHSDVQHYRKGGEIRVNFPGFGSRVATKLRDNEVLNVGKILVGELQISLPKIEQKHLRGNCDGATHYVESALVGAHAVVAGEQAEFSSEAAIFGFGVGGGRSAASSYSKHSGSPKACRSASRKDREPVDECRSPIRLGLAAIGKPAEAKSEDDALARCPRGYAWRDDKCEKLAASVHECAAGDEADCKKMCKRGEVQSCFKLASSYAHAGNTALAIRAFKKACDLKSVEACFNAGVLYETKLADHRAASSAYAEACKLRSASGCFNLGNNLWVARGIQQDKARARKAWSTSCELGLVKACHLGAVHANSLGKKVILLLRACKHGHGESCVDAGVDLEKSGDADFLKKANEMYVLACLRKVGRGCHYRALNYMSGKPEKDFGRALKFYEAGCNVNYAASCTGFGLVLEKGLGGVQKNPARATALYQKACRLKGVLGCRYYGMNALAGLGRRKDPAAAARAFLKACGLGLDKPCSTKKQCKTNAAKACVNLGDLERQGLGIRRSLIEARKTYEVACALGLSSGCQKARALNRGSPGPQRIPAHLLGGGAGFHLTPQPLHSRSWCPTYFGEKAIRSRNTTTSTRRPERASGSRFCQQAMPSTLGSACATTASIQPPGHGTPRGNVKGGHPCQLA